MTSTCGPSQLLTIPVNDPRDIDTNNLCTMMQFDGTTLSLSNGDSSPRHIVIQVNIPNKPKITVNVFYDSLLVTPPYVVTRTTATPPDTQVTISDSVLPLEPGGPPVRGPRK